MRLTSKNENNAIHDRRAASLINLDQKLHRLCTRGQDVSEYGSLIDQPPVPLGHEDQTNTSYGSHQTGQPSLNSRDHFEKGCTQDQEGQLIREVGFHFNSATSTFDRFGWNIFRKKWEKKKRRERERGWIARARFTWATLFQIHLPKRMMIIIISFTFMSYVSWLKQCCHSHITFSFEPGPSYPTWYKRQIG